MTHEKASATVCVGSREGSRIRLRMYACVIACGQCAALSVLMGLSSPLAVGFAVMGAAVPMSSLACVGLLFACFSYENTASRAGLPVSVLSVLEQSMASRSVST
jgi:hypothetical protein